MPAPRLGRVERLVLWCKMEPKLAAAGAVMLASLGLALGLLLVCGCTGPVHAVAFNPDSVRIASGGDDGSIKVWAVALPAPPRQPATAPE
jgi:WD40 repeat protein